MTQPSHRIGPGLLVDAAVPVRFSFDGRAMHGLAGDTLASALLANGQRLVARSLKYHRPRGIVTAGPEEPCALVDVLGPGGREPNRLATTLALHEGLVAVSQNRWPSLRFDLLSVNDRLGRFLPAGFYYKAFMGPGRAWERLYEPLIRRAAGFGRLDASCVPAAASAAETVHDHTDVLVVGAGAAGLAAAHALAGAGLQVMIVDGGVAPGGGALLDPRWQPWLAATLADLAGASHVRRLARCTVIGAYGHGVHAALEELDADASRRCGGLRERLHLVRARAVVLATGAIERLVAVPGNDRPGVMLAGAALAYLRLHGVAVARRPVFFINSDQAYEAVFALADAGLRAAAVIDPRSDSLAAARARAGGLEVRTHALLTAIHGRNAVRAVEVTERASGRRTTIEADGVLLSGGYTPTLALASQLGAPLRWREALAAFTADLDPAIGQVAGAANGSVGLAAAAADGAAAAQRLLSRLGASGGARASSAVPADAAASPLEPVWETGTGGKSFVDLQNDVTAADVRLAAREGYEHVEHMKRYTTHAMAGDQGRIGGLLGSAILAAARGVPLAEVGQVRPRPFVQPVPFAALAGGECGHHFKPKRRLPLHDWHEAAGANFVNIGLWLRPLAYSSQPGWEPVLAEARAVRGAVGITDVSTLGKIDVQGPDAARFLDFVYANTFSTLAVGRARYGIMLREDGMLLDDGTTARLGPRHYLVTTTTANSASVLEHLEFQLQVNRPQWDVRLTDVSDQWAQFAIAGPRAREVIASAVEGVALANADFPFMAASTARIAGTEARLFRISFSGELAYELAVPAHAALPAWEALLAAGRPHGIRPYGLDALNTLRIEKGHVTGAELNGNTSADDLGYGRLLKPQGDFIGRVLSGRPGLRAPDRLQLVGLRPLDQRARLRNGAQLLEATGSTASLGYLTSATMSAAFEGWTALGLLAGGRARIGQRLVAASPVHGEAVEVEVTSAHRYDPENERVRA